MPGSLRIAVRLRDASLAHLGSEYWAKPSPPEPDGLVTNVDTSSAKRSSTLHRDNVYRTYIIIASQMTSGELLN